MIQGGKTVLPPAVNTSPFVVGIITKSKEKLKRNDFLGEMGAKKMKKFKVLEKTLLGTGAEIQNGCAEVSRFSGLNKKHPRMVVSGRNVLDPIKRFAKDKISANGGTGKGEIRS